MRGCKGIPLSLSICFLLHGAGIELGIPTFTVCTWEEMGYIKSSTQQVNTSLNMDRQQAEQQDKLVEVKIQTDCMEDSLQPRGSHGLIKCALTFMAGIVVALAAGFILHYFLFKPSWNQVRNTSYQ